MVMPDQSNIEDETPGSDPLKMPENDPELQK